MTSTVAPETLLAGRYRLVHRLASGGMGQVWRAQDTILERPVAVKLLRSELTEDPAFLRRFRIEARSTAALSHPGIASVFDYGETGEPNPTAYLVAATTQRVTTIMVPSASGQPITTAGPLLARAGFVVRERAQPNPSVKAGIVLAQAPAAGMRRKPGTPVTLIVSSGPAAVAVDPAHYLGQPLDVARTALIKLGLRITVKTAPASGDPGTVVGIAPSGTLRQGDTVAITVASFPTRSSTSAVPGSDGPAPLTPDRGKPVERKHRHDNGGHGMRD